jgi:uncharacterized membrane protein
MLKQALPIFTPNNEPMEYFIFLLLVVILFIIVTNNSGLLKSLDGVDKKIAKLESTIISLKKELDKWKPTDLTAYQRPPEEITNKVVVKETPIEPIKDVVFNQPVTPIVKVSDAKSGVPTDEPTAVPVPKPVVKPVAAKPIPKPAGPTFWERNPDLEKFIGENLINKIGIGILVLGIGFFVKFAIDQNWINEIGRVAIGIACGGILIGLAHKLRKTFKPFSSVLVGGGLAVFYFTIAIAFQDYQIFSQTVAFLLMVVITAFAIVLSIAYDRQELAVLSIIGGFASPMMLSTGAGNYIVLFSYILILNVGMIVLAYFKRWNIVNIVSYAFTMLLYGAWLGTKVLNGDDPYPPYAGALIFATIFYVVFFVMNIINNLKDNQKFVASQIMILVSNTFAYYAAGILILKNIEDGLYQGLFTALIGIFNFIFAYTLYKSKKADMNLIYLLIGMVLTFVSLAAPVQLEGNYITLFWATEAVLLLWLSQKSGIQLIKVSAVVVTALMLISLIMDWFNVYEYFNPETDILFNKAFVTGVIAICSVGFTVFLLKKEKENIFLEVPASVYRGILTVVGIALVYWVGLLELNYQLNGRLDSEGARIIYIELYNFIFALIFILVSFKQKSRFFMITSFVFTTACLLAYMICYQFAVLYMRDDYLFGSERTIHYFVHYVLSALLLAMVALCGLLLHKFYAITTPVFKTFFWVSSAVVLFILSTELQNTLVTVLYSGGDWQEINDLEDHIFQIGYPILWGLCSFLVMYIGMAKKIKTYRIISLVVFSVTLLKLFIVDVTRMSEGGKIAAFISLGVLLLIISFMYQKLKKIIIEDDKKIN